MTTLSLFRETGFKSTLQAQSRPVRSGLHPFWMLLLSCLWMASAGNLALWRQLAALPELQNWRGLGFGIVFGGLILAALTACLSLFTWRWTFKPALTLSLFAAAAGTYFMLTYGVVIDSTMLTNALQTNSREARDLLNWRMLAALALLALPPTLWIWRTPVRHFGLRRQGLNNGATLLVSMAVLFGGVFLFFQDFSSVMRSHTQLRFMINPLSSFYGLSLLAAKPFQHGHKTILPLGQDARAAALPASPGKPPLLVLVLGETARTDNFAVNGYARPTTPLLSRENIVSQRNAWACGTSTAASVPCLFSHLGREGFDARTDNHQGLLDVLQHAGLAVLWIDNQSGCKGVCDRIPHVNTSTLNLPELCAGGECFDEVMLNGLDQQIAALPPERRARGVVLVLHQMGSHGPAYFKRTPPGFKKFMPECASNALQDCAQTEVMNAYDNTILYTDYFLASTITWLKAAEKHAATALIYLSDHGESLGENGLYLHGMPWRVAPEVQKRVPWITWLSPSFEQLRGLSTDCLKQQVDTPVSHDNYFHSVLGVLGVSTAVYQKTMDIYAGCRSA